MLQGLFPASSQVRTVSLRRFTNYTLSLPFCSDVFRKCFLLLFPTCWLPEDNTTTVKEDICRFKFNRNQGLVRPCIVRASPQHRHCNLRKRFTAQATASTRSSPSTVRCIQDSYLVIEPLIEPIQSNTVHRVRSYNSWQCPPVALHCGRQPEIVQADHDGATIVSGASC